MALERWRIARDTVPQPSDKTSSRNSQVHPRPQGTMKQPQAPNSPSSVIAGPSRLPPSTKPAATQQHSTSSTNRPSVPSKPPAKPRTSTTEAQTHTAAPSGTGPPPRNSIVLPTSLTSNPSRTQPLSLPKPTTSKSSTMRPTASKSTTTKPVGPSKPAAPAKPKASKSATTAPQAPKESARVKKRKEEVSSNLYNLTETLLTVRYFSIPDCLHLK